MEVSGTNRALPPHKYHRIGRRHCRVVSISRSLWQIHTLAPSWILKLVFWDLCCVNAILIYISRVGGGVSPPSNGANHSGRKHFFKVCGCNARASNRIRHDRTLRLLRLVCVFCSRPVPSRELRLAADVLGILVSEFRNIVSIYRTPMRHWSLGEFSPLSQKHEKIKKMIIRFPQTLTLCKIKHSYSCEWHSIRWKESKLH